MLIFTTNSFFSRVRNRRSLQKFLGLVLGMIGVVLVPLHAHAERIQLSVGSDPSYVAFYVAAQEKLFEKHGLDVELLKFGAGGASVDAIMAGQGQMSASAETSGIVRMGRGDLRAVGVIGDSGANLKLVVRPDIADPSEIKTYGVVPGGMFEYLTDRGIKKFKSDPAKIKIVNAGAPELPALLARGDIDAFWVFEPFPSIAVKQGAKIIARSEDVGYSYNFWVTVMGPWLETHQQEAKQILAALADACDIVRSNPDQAAEAVRIHIKVPVEVTRVILNEVECNMRDFSNKDFETYDDIADYMARTKITSTRVDYRKQLANGFYQAK